jgi:hypothetical protein
VRYLGTSGRAFPFVLLPPKLYPSMVLFMTAGLGFPRYKVFTRLVLAAFLLVSASVSSAAPLQGSHCQRHSSVASSSATHGNHNSEPLTAPSWTQDADCSHCPPTECSRVAPCATSGTMAAAEVRSPIAALSAHAVSLNRYDQQRSTKAVQPPTPPPQLIA